ncbi:LpxL/LpxP family acyltransferase [Methylobacterium isbiliense]|uniref:Lipid A biosynthesis lauroyltransferase n=1 Tax=Methylobacterium isbiliense TaxID=315478 RepID=A0ABQ4S8Y6_9HYPH|nr:hypothetical protein [Methylobacterium isbiliense]MDN3626297.1 hypothetical protein [Methylobacterium isbiliense]GJD98582.1 Lipid A biosynthesis lauroyltransferase [Methylobacterium isbiliense]
MDTAPHLPLLYGLLARLPLRWRRRALGIALAARSLCVRLTGRTDGLGLAEMFQVILRLPRREAVRLDRAALHHDRVAEIEWCALRTRSLPAILRDLDLVRVDQPEVLRRAASTGRPVILAPLHMGSYVLGLASLMVRFFPGRPMLVLRQRDDMAMETQVIERLRELGAEVRFLNVGARADFLSAVRFAQKGAVVVVFCDLPPAYGAPVPMPMFGRPFSFAFGTDTLARLTGALVVPCATTIERDGDLIRIGQPFEVRGSAPEERAEAARIMARHIRAALTARPEQWHLWSTLGEYLPEAAKIPDDPSAGEGTPRDIAA